MLEPTIPPPTTTTDTRFGRPPVASVMTVNALRLPSASQSTFLFLLERDYQRIMVTIGFENEVNPPQSNRKSPVFPKGYLIQLPSTWLSLLWWDGNEYVNDHREKLIKHHFFHDSRLHILQCHFHARRISTSSFVMS
jgi:hypothetical protein